VQGGQVSVAIQREDQGFTALGKGKNYRIEQRLGPEYWLLRINNGLRTSDIADLYAADWSRDLLSLDAAGTLAPGERFWKGATAGSLPAFARTLFPQGAPAFVPTTAYTWGLFYNRRLFAGLARKEPRSLRDLETLAVAAKKTGTIPFALGAGAGWPAFAWFLYIDSRLNGGDAAMDRILGSKPWNDKAGLAAATRLAGLRDQGLFSPKAAALGVDESLAELASGKALFVLMGAFAAGRTARPEELGFCPFPETGQGPRGEIVSLGGFVVPSRSAHQGAALSVMDAYLALGATLPPGDTYRLVLPLPSTPPSGIRALEAAIIGATGRALPPPDRALLPRMAQDAWPLFSAFFSASPLAPQALVDGLEALAARDRS